MMSSMKLGYKFCIPINYLPFFWNWYMYIKYIKNFINKKYELKKSNCE